MKSGVAPRDFKVLESVAVAIDEQLPMPRWGHPAKAPALPCCARAISPGMTCAFPRPRLSERPVALRWLESARSRERVPRATAAGVGAQSGLVGLIFPRSSSACAFCACSRSLSSPPQPSNCEIGQQALAHHVELRADLLRIASLGDLLRHLNVLGVEQILLRQLLRSRHDGLRKPGHPASARRLREAPDTIIGLVLQCRKIRCPRIGVSFGNIGVLLLHLQCMLLGVPSPMLQTRHS